MVTQGLIPKLSQVPQVSMKLVMEVKRTLHLEWVLNHVEVSVLTIKPSNAIPLYTPICLYGSFLDRSVQRTTVDNI